MLTVSQVEWFIGRHYRTAVRLWSQAGAPSTGLVRDHMLAMHREYTAAKRAAVDNQPLTDRSFHTAPNA